MNKTGFYEIKDEFFWHTTTGINLSVGDILQINNKNGMYHKVYDKDFTINNAHIYDEEGHLKKAKRHRLYRSKTIDEYKNVIDNYDFTLRELALENVRNESFKKYPSRFNCLYVCRSLEEGLVWFSYISHGKENCQFVKLKCTGNIFTGDSRINAKRNYSYKTILENAKKYWCGNTTANPRLETLFIGEAEVVEIIDEKIKK